MREQEESGKSRREFCEERGINVMTFHGWFKKAKPAVKGFAEVVLPDNGSGAEIEIGLANGSHIWIRPGKNRKAIS